MSGDDARALPWRDSDVVMVSITAFLGLAAIGGAWFGASGSVSVSGQMAWLNLAVGGFVIAAVGSCLWLLRLRRAVGERRIGLVALDTGPDVTDDHHHGPAPRPRGSGTSTDTLRLVRGPEMNRVHYADCPLVAGKPVESATVADGEPCGVCGR